VGAAAQSKDLDYEASGQGFVSRVSLQRHPSLLLGLQRRHSFESSQHPPAQAAGEQKTQDKPLGVPDVAIEIAKLTVPNQSAGTGASVVAAATTEAGADGADATTSPLVPSDAIWVLTPAQVAAKFPESNIDINNPKGSRGLSSEEAALRLARDGKNELKPPKEHSELVKFLILLCDPLNILLTVAGILSAAVAYPIDTSNSLNLYLGVVLFVVVLLNSTFAYVQEGKASNVMKAFKNMLPAQARVVRDGKQTSVPANELVVGDIMIVGTGDIIPADMRLLWTQDCKVETSSLTGESLPITCAIRSPNTLKIEQARNVCFNSSKCLEGESWGVVIASGDHSLIGQIAGLAGQTKTEPTTLQKEIILFVQRLSIGASILGIVFFVIGMARGQDWLFSFINGFIVVLIACIPQGLPITVVSCLTITSKRLSEQKVFVKQLQSVETLGSVSVIATDKTGTLTQNIMSVANM
jgi:sodium/potassium-transporting ATPase subunit alpha